MRRLTLIAVVFAASVFAPSVNAGEEPSAQDPGDHDDELLPELPASPAEDPPRGVQDGVIGAAQGGAAAGLVHAASTQTEARVLDAGVANGRPASRYAALDRQSCEAELGRRKIGFERVGEARGVLAPVRLTGAVGGVSFHSMLPASQRKTATIEIVDCRLVLALDDFARILAKHDVVEVVHYSFYRPPPKKAVLSGPGRRHPGGLAIDAAKFVTKSGKTIDVEKDFRGRIGAKTCGAGAAAPASLPENAATLRRIVCEAADAQLFHVLLTPDYNWAHRNHFHLEVTANARWQFVR